MGTLELEKHNDGRAVVDIRTITKLIPIEVFPEVETQEDIMETLRDMEKRKLVSEWATSRYIDEYSSIITVIFLIAHSIVLC